MLATDKGFQHMEACLVSISYAKVIRGSKFYWWMIQNQHGNFLGGGHSPKAICIYFFRVLNLGGLLEPLHYPKSSPKYSWLAFTWFKRNNNLGSFLNHTYDQRFGNSYFVHTFSKNRAMRCFDIIFQFSKRPNEIRAI